MPSAMLTQDEKKFSMNWGAGFHEDTQCAMTFILDFFDSIIISNEFLLCISPSPTFFLAARNEVKIFLRFTINMTELIPDPTSSDFKRKVS